MVWLTYRMVLHEILRLLGWLFCRAGEELSFGFDRVQNLDRGSLAPRRQRLNFQCTIAANLFHLTLNTKLFAFSTTIANSILCCRFLEKVSLTIDSSFFIVLHDIISKLLTVLSALVRRPTALVSHSSVCFQYFSFQIITITKPTFMLK